MLWGNLVKVKGDNRMRNHKKSEIKILFLILILAVIICFLVVVVKNKYLDHTEKETGMLMQKQDAFLLFGYLCCKDEDLYQKQMDIDEFSRYLIQDASNEDKKTEKTDKDTDDQDSEAQALTKDEALYMIEILKDLYPIYEGEIEKKTENAFDAYKKGSSGIAATDYFDLFYSLWEILHADVPVEEKSVIPLAYDQDITILNEETAAFEAPDTAAVAYFSSADSKEIEVHYFANGFQESQKEEQSNHLFNRTVYLSSGDYVLADITSYYEAEKPAFDINTVFIVSNQPMKLLVEYQDFRLLLNTGTEAVKTKDGENYNSFENIADIHFEDGGVSYVEVYTDYVSGKLLRVDDSQIELEGSGTYDYSGRLPVYKLYGEKELYSKADLKIGYDFTDFVLNHDGQVVAGLVTREENMENIRVLIKASDFASAFHDSITLTCDQNYFVNDEKHLAGEEFTVSKDDPVLDNGRIYIRPETNLARTSFLSISRAQGVPAYRGNFEIVRTEDGLILINEVLLEEYLYSVVPSEMPSSYPTEALKAQAVCARTYAYDKMQKPGLMNYGSHVDDSAGFQVYNNIDENENTTLAIRETKDMILTYEGHPAEVYYYSTSCGFGTDIDAWHSPSADLYRYMVSKHLSDEEFTDDITNEEVFRKYISEIHEADFEASQSWYRWSYQTNFDIDRLNQNLIKRYEAGSKNVQTLNAQGEYETTLTPPVFSKVERMEVLKREDGGVIDELLIQGPEGSVKVIGEHNVRAVLVNETDYVTLANGKQSHVAGLLPSAFAFLDVSVDPDTNSVHAYSLTGGGYGHGIGMSQNGAKAMADRGYTCTDILQFFFENTTVLEY